VGAGEQFCTEQPVSHPSSLSLSFPILQQDSCSHPTTNPWTARQTCRGRYLHGEEGAQVRGVLAHHHSVVHKGDVHLHPLLNRGGVDNLTRAEGDHICIWEGQAFVSEKPCHIGTHGGPAGKKQGTLSQDSPTLQRWSPTKHTKDTP
jgi:hypothetical protein